MDDKEYKRQWYLANRERILAERLITTTEEDRKRKSEYDKNRRLLKGDSLREYDRLRSKTPERKAVKRNWSRKRQMTIKQATPNWLSELDDLFIKEIYHLAVLRSELLGIDYHVDHIIPLHGKNVCGLHLPNNLQLLPASENIKKNNSHP